MLFSSVWAASFGRGHIWLNVVKLNHSIFFVMSFEPIICEYSYLKNIFHGVFTKHRSAWWGAVSGIEAWCTFRNRRFSHISAFTFHCFDLSLSSNSKRRIVVMNRYITVWVILLVSWILVWRKTQMLGNSLHPASCGKREIHQEEPSHCGRTRWNKRKQVCRLFFTNLSAT